MSNPSLAPPRFRLCGICMEYGADPVLEDVDLEVRAGEVHALVGENGAGKSTLGKVLGGAVRPTRGLLELDGEERRYHHPAEALRDGTALISQELALVPARSVLENVFLASARGFFTGRTERRALLGRFQELATDTGFEVSPDAIVRDLSTADQQKIEILRALALRATTFIFDEPTTSLGYDDTQRLLSVMRRLAGKGRAVVFVSHALEDVLGVADVVTVLRNGRIEHHGPAAQETTRSLVTHMLGRPLEQAFPHKQLAPAGAPVLELHDLRVGDAVNGVSLHVRSGEILGIGGLVGSGRSELALGTFAGLGPRTGSVRLDGRELHLKTPHDAIDAGIVLLPESRRDQGLVMGRPIVENLSLMRLDEMTTAGVIDRRAERKKAGALATSLGITPYDPTARTGNLSGGNQQKVLFGKCLHQLPRVLIADEPTRGVDIGARLAIYELITSVARDGVAVIIISSDVDELVGLAHRVVVMRGGRVEAELHGEVVTHERIIRAAFGEAVA